MFFDFCGADVSMIGQTGPCLLLPSWHSATPGEGEPLAFYRIVSPREPLGGLLAGNRVRFYVRTGCYYEGGAEGGGGGA